MPKIPSVLFAQIFVLVYALVAAFFPQYFFLIFILFIATIFGMSIYGSLKHKVSGKAGEILSGRKLYSEKNAMNILLKDPEGVKDLSRQVKYSFLPLLLLPVYMGLFYLYGSYILPYFTEGKIIVVNDIITRYVGYLLMYEMLIGIGTSVNRLIYSKGVGGMIMVPANYEVTDKGIVGRGVIIPFPLDKYNVSIEFKRRFIQLEPLEKRGTTKMIIRLYASDIEKLAKIIKRHGLKQKSIGKEKE